MKAMDYAKEYTYLLTIREIKQAQDRIISMFAEEGKELIKNRNCQGISAKEAVVREQVDKFRKFCDLASLYFEVDVISRGFSRLLL